MIASTHTVNASVEALSDTAIETSGAAVEMDSSIAETGVYIDELSAIIDTTASSVVEMTSAIREIARSADTLNHSTESTAQALELLSESVRSVESNATESQVLSDHTAKEGGAGDVGGPRDRRGHGRDPEVLRGDRYDHFESIGEERIDRCCREGDRVGGRADEPARSQCGDHLLPGRRTRSCILGRGRRGSEPRRARGVELSNEAGRILRDIGESTKQSTRWADQIREALQVFREATVQSARRAEETSETVSDLSAHAEGLEKEIGRFRL